MKFPEDTKVGDLFWMNNDPIRVIAWNYRSNSPWDSYFDIEFLDITKDNIPAASMRFIPIGFDFQDTTIKRMSSLEKELF